MKKIFLLFICSITLFAYDATIDVIKKIERTPKILVQDASGDYVDKTLNKKVFKLLIGDLKVSANFNVDGEYVKSSYEGDFKENFLSEKHLDLILRYKLQIKDSGKVAIYTKLINAKNGSDIFEKTYTIGSKERYPFLSHMIVVDVNNEIGGHSIDWMKRFVVFAKYTSAKESEIVISDYTLSFQKSVVKGGLNIFPKWANDDQNSFYYTSYNGYLPTVYRVDLYNGKRQKIISGKGMLVCSDVSRDGRKLLLTMAPSDQPDIYLYDIKSRKKEKITKYRGIDVSGSFVDGDQGVVFVSDRLGYPNIFSKSLYGGGVEQMVYHGKNNSSCSSYKNYIVYSSRERSSEFGPSTFNLYLISTKTDYIRQLTATGKNLYPRFANESETIMFIKRYKRQSALGIIRLGANKSYNFPLKVGKIQSIDW